MHKVCHFEVVPHTSANLTVLFALCLKINTTPRFLLIMVYFISGHLQCLIAAV